MVSLSRSFNGGGATFFGESTQRMEDQNELLAPDLELIKNFRPLKTIWAKLLHTFFTLGLEIAAIVLAIVRPDKSFECETYYILLYLHAALWIITLIVDNILRLKHHELRMNGYLDFYKKIYNHHRLPFYVVSLWTTNLLFIQTLVEHLYRDKFEMQCLKGAFFSPTNSLLCLITFEVFFLLVINFNYIVRVHHFNKTEPLPDVQREEWTACSTSDGFANQPELGYRPNADRVSDFIEKQCDLIRYLKEHNNRLSEKVMMLNAQVKMYREQRQ